MTYPVQSDCAIGFDLRKSALVKTKKGQRLQSYYAWLAQDGLPRRRDIDLTTLKRMLPNLFLLAPTDGNGWLFRVCGTEIALMYGVELTGKTTSEAYAPEARSCTERMYREIAESGQGNVFSGTLLAKQSRYQPVEVLHLPIRSDTDGRTLILGGLFPLDS